ncbi:hypothetical protein IMSHALPRED_003146 [Imshaugia aleurites]|uniref:Cell wall mannoprotein PIR1-like C-terminal domain-containing protein n=1 Tax=Imshaugia aleurites TaxID=172621 RepID=A0A8H3PJQ0_9LECA|nr:hypothetical protein IMSHALPRED_003146 [Imshaugia aleurites]
MVSAQTPDGCSADYSGTFEYNPVSLSSASKRDLVPLHKRQTTVCTAQPYSTLKGGVLTDQCERTGEIVANAQFQYDLLVQNNAINTGGFSICSNGTLAVAGSAIFYHCLSGNFYNLYDASIGAQCSPVYLEIIPCTLPSDPTAGCPADTPSSALSPAASSSSTTTPVAVSSTPSTPAATTPAAVTSAAPSAPAAYVVSMPYTYATSNATTSAIATGTGAATPVSTSTPTTSPIAFHGAAASLAMGGKLLVSAVGIAALAFLA